MHKDEDLSSSSDNLKSYYCPGISCLLEEYGFPINVYIIRHPKIGLNEDHRTINNNYQFHLSHQYIKGERPSKDRIQAGRTLFYYLLSDKNRVVTDETDLRFRDNRFHQTNWWLN